MRYSRNTNKLINKYKPYKAAFSKSSKRIVGREDEKGRGGKQGQRARGVGDRSRSILN